MPVQDSAALAEAMEHLADRPDVRAEMGRESIDYCRAKFDVHAVNARLLEITGLAGDGDEA